MASNSHMIPSLLVLYLFFNFSAGDFSRKLVGNWRPVNPKDPKIQEIGEFAVTEYNHKFLKGNPALKLKYNQVLKGESQVVSGMNYRLLISASIKNGKLSNYEAIVWDQQWKHFRNLTSFVPASKD